MEWNLSIIRSLIKPLISRPIFVNHTTAEKKEIGVIEFLLNSRPRKLLKWEEPAEVFVRKSEINLVGGALAT
jgi:hypothetical protein